jgi:hypothetical protein
MDGTFMHSTKMLHFGLKRAKTTTTAANVLGAKLWKLLLQILVVSKL